jgi:hypothetical protein
MPLEMESLASIQDEPEENSDTHSVARLAFRVERRRDGRLWVVDANGETPVELTRCFPWSAPDKYLSLRNERGEERAFVANTNELDPASRATVEATLARAGFVLDVTRIVSIEEDFELRLWVVETVQGERRFQTPLDSFPRELEADALVIQDVFGDLYRIRDPRSMDAKSRKLLWAFTD